MNEWTKNIAYRYIERKDMLVNRPLMKGYVIYSSNQMESDH